MIRSLTLLAPIFVAVVAFAAPAQAAGPFTPVPLEPVISSTLENVQYRQRSRGTRCKTRVGICPLNISGSKPLGSSCACKFPNLKARASGFTVR